MASDWGWWLVGSKSGIPTNERPRLVLVEACAGIDAQFIIYNGEPCEGNGVVLKAPEKRDLHRLIAAANRELERM